jgi:hypothetical protein
MHISVDFVGEDRTCTMAIAVVNTSNKPDSKHRSVASDHQCVLFSSHNLLLKQPRYNVYFSPILIDIGDPISIREMLDDPSEP